SRDCERPGRTSRAFETVRECVLRKRSRRGDKVRRRRHSRKQGTECNPESRTDRRVRTVRQSSTRSTSQAISPSVRRGPLRAKRLRSSAAGANGSAGPCLDPAAPGANGFCRLCRLHDSELCFREIALGYLGALVFVLCSLFFVLCTLYFVLCTLCFVLCTLVARDLRPKT